MIKKIIDLIVNFNKSKQIKADNSIRLQKAESAQNTRLNELIDNNINLRDIPDAFQLLLSSDDKLKLHVAKILNKTMKTLNSSSLVKVEEIFRERNSNERYYNWEGKNPKELLHPLMSEEEQSTILGLSSFHPNGYFREKAIIALSDMETDYAIPYLLIRINDWIRQVRIVSKEQLQRYLTEKYAAGFVKNLPLVLRLKECSRDEHLDIMEAVISVISSTESSQNLINGLQSTDWKVRLACYKIILQTKVIDNKKIIDYLIKDTNPYIRVFVFRNIKQEISKEEFVQISHLLLNDRFFQIRIIALELLNSFMPEEAVTILEKSLFDTNKSIRDFSRYLISKHKKYDFAGLYRDSIQKNERVYSSICGLGECGNINDSKIISKFINSDSGKIEKAAIIALARLDLQEYKEEILLRLKDERASISKTVRRILSKEVNASDEDAIYKIFKETTYEHVRINASILLCSLSKWNAIRHIIEFCADKNVSISTIGQSALERWRLKYNQSFMTPGSKQIKELREALERFRKSIKNSDREFIESCIHDFDK